jgi:NAD-dependent dihydropyrimidine dehydrogenase PreA subunit
VSSVLRQHSKSREGKVVAGKSKPVRIEFLAGAGPNKVHFADGNVDAASCLRCHDAPCYRYAAGEGESSSLSTLPADRNDEICPTGAVSIAPRTGAAVIDATQCIYCGVCAARCPVGAIFLSQNKGAVVVDEANAHFAITAQYSEAEMLASRNPLEQAQHTGALLQESDALIADIAGRLAAVRVNLTDNFPNHLARNLLRATGIAVDMRRVGNNHLRADLVLGTEGIKQGVVEVEFGDEAILDSPRDLLDDIAVFVSRHGWKKDDIVALIVGDVLPNRRSEFWHIIKDIREVLGVQIATVTVLALMLLVWERRKLPSHINKLAHTDCDTPSYREAVLEKLLGRKIALTVDVSAMVEVIK